MWKPIDHRKYHHKIKIMSNGTSDHVDHSICVPDVKKCIITPKMAVLGVRMLIMFETHGVGQNES